MSSVVRIHDSPPPSSFKNERVEVAKLKGGSQNNFVYFSAGIAQLARASAFQAEGRGFEPRFPLHTGS